MARTKKTKTLKEPVRIRLKKLANGTQSIYLDIYHKGKRSYEFLKLYLLLEVNEATKRQNEATMAAANAIKSQMIIKLANNDAGLRNTSVHAKMLLLDWMDTYYNECERRGRKGNKLILNTIKVLGKYKTKIQMGQIDRDYCIGFRDFLCHKYRTKNDKRLSDYTIINYMGCLRGALNEAVRADIIPDNPMNRLSQKEKVKAPESQREYLTIEELKLLVDTPCDYPVVKQTFLFACNCGLRLSDVRKLKWGDLYNDNGQWRVNIVMFKTQTPLYLPLSHNAMRWLPERNGASDDKPVFSGMYQDHYLNARLKEWIKSAGIKKPVTFHVSRHTFATTLLTLGVDLYTVSKLLGHAKIDTTQIYGKIINKKKDDAIGLFDQAFE